MIERIADAGERRRQSGAARALSQHDIPDGDRRPGLSGQDHRGPHRLDHARPVRHAELQLCVARAARRMGDVLEEGPGARPQRHLRAVQARQAHHRRRPASVHGEPALHQGRAGRAARSARSAPHEPALRAHHRPLSQSRRCSAARTGSTSRRPAKAFRCSACTPRAPTGGSTAACSTTSASPTTTASSCSTCRGTASRRRRRAFRTRSTSSPRATTSR